VAGPEVELLTSDDLLSPVEATPEPGPLRPRLLLVEDDSRTHNALRKILSRLGWEVHSAMTVAGGLALLDIKPEAIILDLMLPDGDGEVVLRKVRTDLLPAKVAITTGIEDHRRLEEIRKLRPDALLRKPLDLNDLLRVFGVNPTA
jgi:DNA-binding response OmpR family regulator